MSKLYYYLRKGQVSTEPVPWDEIPITAEQVLPMSRAGEEPPPWQTLHRSPPAPAASQTQKPPRVIEQTAKRWKGHLLCALAVCAVGMIMIVGDIDGSGTAVWGGFLFISGICYFLLVRFMSWWHHG